MPFALLLLISFTAGSLTVLGAGRMMHRPRSSTWLAAMVGDPLVRRGKWGRWLRARFDPALATGLGLTAAVVLSIMVGFVVALVAHLTRAGGRYASIDSGTASWAHDHATRFSTRLLWLTTHLGDWRTIPLFGLVLIVSTLRSRPNWHLIAFLIVVTLGDQIVTTTIKFGVDRARPTFTGVAATLGPSFPSGHSATAASFYAAVALILASGHGSRARSLLAGGAVTIAVAVATSRVLLNLHWLSDVIAGLLVGWTWFALCALAFGFSRLRQ